MNGSRTPEGLEFRRCSEPRLVIGPCFAIRHDAVPQLAKLKHRVCEGATGTDAARDQLRNGVRCEEAPLVWEVVAREKL